MSLYEEAQDILMGAADKQPLIFPWELPIHRQLKVKRIADNFTQTELAKILGCGVSTLSEIENGRRRIPYKYLERVKQYLYCEMYCDKEFNGYVGQSW